MPLGVTVLRPGGTTFALVQDVGPRRPQVDLEILLQFPVVGQQEADPQYQDQLGCGNQQRVDPFQAFDHAPQVSQRSRFGFNLGNPGWSRLGQVAGSDFESAIFGPKAQAGHQENQGARQ